MEVVEEGIGVDEKTSHSCIDERTPPPSVIFSGQLEVQQGYADERSHNKEEYEGKEKNSEESVHLVPPHCSEDVMKFDVDCRKGQESRNNHLHEATTIPRYLRGDFARHFGGTGGGIEIMAGIILCQNTS